MPTYLFVFSDGSSHHRVHESDEAAVAYAHAAPATAPRRVRAIWPVPDNPRDSLNLMRRADQPRPVHEIEHDLNEAVRTVDGTGTQYARLLATLIAWQAAARDEGEDATMYDGDVALTRQMILDHLARRGMTPGDALIALGRLEDLQREWTAAVRWRPSRPPRL